jgi:DNA-directed RNA polymerase subunit E'/Rpb7
MDKLKVQLEGKCSKHGFVIPGTMELLSRSLGYSEKGRFTSDFLYYIKAQGKVYNPPDGTIVEGEVSRKSKAGLYVIIEDAIHIMIVRDLHIGNEEFDSIELGERIRVEIKRSRFQVNDPHILSIGQFLGRVGGSAAVASVETLPPAAASAEGEAVVGADEGEVGADEGEVGALGEDAEAEDAEEEVGEESVAEEE